MKLLIYSQFFTPSIGGVENIVRSLAGGLAELRGPDGKREFEVSVATQTAAGEFDDRALPFRVIRQPNLIRLYRLTRDSDLIHIAGPALRPLVLAKLARRPVVIEHHGYQAICPNGILIQQPDRSVCPGHFQAGHYLKCLQCGAHEISWLQSLKRLALMLPRHWLARGAATNISITQHVNARHALPKSTVIYYGIEDSGAKNFIEHPAAQNSGPLRFAFAGRFVTEKGIPILLEAARILRDDGHKFEVLLIGDGPERTRLETQIARDGLENCVRITGFLQGVELAAALDEVQIVVMPSVWEETAGLSAIEQMMRGRLVIGSKIGGLGEVIGGGGLTFPPGEPHALARCMKQALGDKEMIDSIGRKALARASQLFRRERMIEKHARLYRNVMFSEKA
jgi:glycogen synthase